MEGLTAGHIRAATWEEVEGTHWLITPDGRRLAGIDQRNRYCDRGHWQLLIDYPCGLDAQDGFPRYFMRLDRAKAEAVDFLLWRVAKIRAEQTPPTLLDVLTWTDEEFKQMLEEINDE